MDTVNSFNGELSSLMDCKPPVSKAKMTSVTKAAIKAVKFYKHVVQGVEKFIQKCRPEFKVPGLYVIDSIVRQSRHQFGADKDVFAMRFARNFNITFQNLFRCPPEEKSKIVRVLNLWQKNSVFTSEVIQPLLDMANPNHMIHQQASVMVTGITSPSRKQDSCSGWTGWPNEGGTAGQTDGELTLKAVNELLQQTHQASVAGLLQSGSQNLNQSLAESNLLLQLQQLTAVLTQQSHFKPSDQENTVKFNKKLLDFDYSDEEDDDDKKEEEPAHQQMQDGSSLAVSMAQNLLSNPDLLRQLQQMQQTLQQTEVLKTELSIQEQLSKQRLWQADDLTQMIGPGVQTVPLQYQPVNSQQPAPLQPPPPFDLGSFPTVLPPPPSLSGIPMPLGMGGLSPSVPPLAPPPFLPLPTEGQASPSVTSAITIVAPNSIPVPESFPVIDLEDPDLPENQMQVDDQDRASSDQERDKTEKERVSEKDERNRSPSRRKERSRSRSLSRSKKKGRRSRSRSRSPRRGRSSRSRSGSRTRNRHKRDRRSRSKEREREKERERDRERKKRGLPPFKKDHVGVCSTTLWLGHVSKLVSEEDLADTFGEFGDIVAIDLIPPRGCAFVCMNRRQDAYRALQKLKNLKLQGKTITMAWAPGKGVKGKDYKDYWDAELGVSYIPYEKIPNDIDLDALEDGGMIDEETMPERLKEKQKKNEKEKQKAAKDGDQKDSKGETGNDVVSKDAGAELKQAQVPQPTVMPPMMPPPIVPPQFGLPPMVPGMMSMPVGVPPPMMVPPVNQPPMMGQAMMPTMPRFGIPPPPAMKAPVPSLPSVPEKPMSSDSEKTGGSDGTPIEESGAGSPDDVHMNDSQQTLVSADHGSSSLASPNVSTPTITDAIVCHSSIPLPPGSAPSSVTNTVMVGSTSVMPPAVPRMPNQTAPMGMMQFQPFMPPPHMFRPSGFGMMPPPMMLNMPPGMNMRMGNMGVGSMPQGINAGLPNAPPPLLPGMPNMRPGMPSVRPPLPEQNLMAGSATGTLWGGVAAGTGNQGTTSADVDMRGPASAVGTGRGGQMVNGPFRGPNMHVPPLMRPPASMPQSTPVGPMGRPSDRGSLHNRSTNDKEPTGGPGPRPPYPPLPRSGTSDRLPSILDCQSTPIEARLSRLADMGDIVPVRNTRNVGDHDGHSGQMPPSLFQGQGPGSIMGRFSGPRMDGPPRLGGPQHIGSIMGPRPSFGRFPGPSGLQRLPLDGARFHGSRFPSGHNPRAPLFMDNERDFDRMRSDFTDDRSFRDHHSEREDRFGSQRDINGDQCQDDFGWNRGLSRIDDFRDRAEGWRGRTDPEYELEFRTRFKLDRREREDRQWMGRDNRNERDFKREDGRFRGGWDHEDRDREERDCEERDKEKDVRERDRGHDRDRDRDRSREERSHSSRKSHSTEPGVKSDAPGDGSSRTESSIMGEYAASAPKSEEVGDVNFFPVKVKVEMPSPKVKVEPLIAMEPLEMKSELNVKTEPRSCGEVGEIQNGDKSDAV